MKRKWVEGVLGTNKRVYGIPYDADVVLEIDPENHALFIFGNPISNFGAAGCIITLAGVAAYNRAPKK